MKKIRGYKGFDENLKCWDFQYEIGKTYKMDGPIRACERGFHFCEDPHDVLNYYDPTQRFCIVEGSGIISRENSDSKVACSVITIIKELSLDELITEMVAYKLAHTSPGTAHKGVASATLDHGHAFATGDKSAASATGDYGAAHAVGFLSAARANGYRGAASVSGEDSVASASGDFSAACASGDYSAAFASGVYGSASATGRRVTACATGTAGSACAVGDYGSASATGYQGVACSLGFAGRAKAAIGGWIVVAEFDSDGNRIDVKCRKVDGKRIKANTYYILKGGKFVEESL